MRETEIAWTDSTFNPWWGCVKVSPGCKHCYAETFAHRLGLKVWGQGADHRRFGDKHWREPEKWNADAAKAGVRRRVFCASMADVFEGRDEDAEDRARLFSLIERTPWLDWLLLTKRPENMVRLAPSRWVHPDGHGFPRNVWTGCTVEDQQRADERIPHLLRVPAAVRFLSMEPLLEAVDLSAYLSAMAWHDKPFVGVPWVDWVIVGGESGGCARPFDLEWARSIVAQCKEDGVPVFVKQMGADPIERRSTANGVAVNSLGLASRKGGDMAEWPEDLRVREFPKVTP